ncbi:deoxyguanosinetriphosphate triphosphohydrolase, partial [Pseudomonas syringae pv. tagetis]
NAKDMARKNIFQDKRKTLHEIGAYTSLEILLNAFCGAAVEQIGGRTPSLKHRRILGLLGNRAPAPTAPLHASIVRLM